MKYLKNIHEHKSKISSGRKKIIGILSIAVLAVTLFTSTNLINNSSNWNLSSLITLNTANAESCSGTGCLPDCEFYCFSSPMYGCAVLSEGVVCHYRRTWNG